MVASKRINIVLKILNVKTGSRAVTFIWRGVVAFVCASLFASSSAMAADASTSQITRTVLERHEIPGTDEEMQMILAEFPPGTVSALHHHTVEGLVYVLEGTAESAYGNDAPKIYHAGDVMKDIPDVPHTIFRNPDPDHTLRILIFTNLHKGQPYRIVP